MGCAADIRDLKPRVGQLGVLYWDEKSRLVQRLEKHDMNCPQPFPYDTSDVTDDFATRHHIQNAELGSYVSLVLCAHRTEQSETSTTQEPFLIVHGIDMDGAMVGPIRLWRWTEADADMQSGGVYIIRGLKVVKQTVWSDVQWAYIPSDDGSQTVESSFRVAVENVSGVPDITSYFS